MGQRKKHQQSKIDRLPPDIREKLDELLRDRRVTQLETTRRINAILDQTDHSERMDKSSVNRYFLRMEDVGAKIRETREVAQMWIGKLGSEPAGEVGKLLNEMVRGLAFRAAMTASEGDEPVDPKLLKSLAVSVHRLERAASENAALEEKVRKRTLEDAAETAGEAAKQAGASDETIKAVRRDVLRMADA